MPSADFDSLYDQAHQRWPQVGWDRRAYAAHLGDGHPKYAIDLYLAGAAGHRLDEAWVVVDTEMGSHACRVLRRLPTADYDIKDLWADTLVKMMKDDLKSPSLPDGRQPAAIIRYRGEISLLNYLIVVARRVAIQRDRQRRSRPTILSLAQKSDHDDRPRDWADPSSPAPDARLTQQDTIDQIRQSLVEAREQLTNEQRFIIMMVFGQGMKQKEVGALMNWHESKVSRQLKAAIQCLQQALEGFSPSDWTPAIVAAWEGCWASDWQDVQDRPRHASDGVKNDVSRTPRMSVESEHERYSK